MECNRNRVRNGIGQLPSGQAVKRFCWNAQQIFHKAETAKLKYSEVLKQAGEFLQAYLFAVGPGFSDTTGDADKEKALTEARAWWSAIIR